MKPAPFGLGNEYSLEVLEEIPSDGKVRYFPDHGESPLLVRFTRPDGSSWVGGFGAGNLAARAYTGVFALPTRACVVSRGRAYAVDVQHPDRSSMIIPELVTQVMPNAAACMLLLADPWELHAFGEGGLMWSTGRISVEGLSVISTYDQTALVRVEDADGEFAERKIDIRTGNIE